MENTASETLCFKHYTCSHCIEIVLRRLFEGEAKRLKVNQTSTSQRDGMFDVIVKSMEKLTGLIATDIAAFYSMPKLHKQKLESPTHRTRIQSSVSSKIDSS